MSRIAVGIGDCLPQTRRLRRLDTRASDGLDQQATVEKSLVAEHLGIEPEPRAAGE